MDKLDHQYNSEDEITLKELILKIQEFWRELWRNWWLILLFCVPFVVYFGYKNLTSIPIYSTQVKFIVEGEGSGGMGGLGGFLGQFGISNGGGETNPMQLIEVANSKTLIKEILFSEINTNEKELVANLIIDQYQLNSKWKEMYPELIDYKFAKNSLEKFENFKNFENYAFHNLHQKLTGSPKSKTTPLVKVKYEKENGVFLVNSNTESELLSLNLGDKMYEELKYFFEERILVDKIKGRDLLSDKVDSLKSLIDTKATKLAIFEDQNRGLIQNERKSIKQKLSIEIQGLTVAYSEALKSFELADFTLKQSKPLFLQIDKSLAPILPEKESLLKRLILAFLIGIILGSIFVISRLIIRQTLQD